jgi:hypothetical protein
MAYLILKNDAAAEREFASLRTSLAPVVGDYATSKSIALDRLLAALYSGHWQEIIAEWPQGGSVSNYRLGLVAARAYLETGKWEEAEHYLRTVPLFQRTRADSLFIASGDFLAYALGEFYQAKVFEHAGKKADAVNAYQEFRAALKRLL